MRGDKKGTVMALEKDQTELHEQGNLRQPQKVRADCTGSIAAKVSLDGEALRPSPAQIGLTLV
jgi:hypothetical protein